MNLYEQLQKLIDAENSKDTLKEILKELREIKKLLIEQNRSDPKAYYNFINNIRKEFKTYIDKNIFPEIIYKDRPLVLNHKGHIYDKKSNLELPANEAFKVFRYLYKNKDNLDKLIKIWYNFID